MGNYLRTHWTITDTLPIYNQAGVIPGQTDPKLSTSRNYFEAHPGWAATTLFDSQGNRAGTFLGERYHIYWIDNPDYSGPGSPVFVGVDVGTSDPFPADGSGDEDGGRGEFTRTVPFVTPIEDGGAKSILDGLEIECSRISGNSSVQCPNNDCNATVLITGFKDGREVGRWIEPAPEGWDPAYDGTYKFNDSLPWRRVGGDPPFRSHSRASGGQQHSHHAQSSQVPQNRTPLTGAQIDKLASNLQKFFDDPECAKYIKTLLGSLPNDVWKTNKYSGSLMDTFNRIKYGGGFWSGETISKRALGFTDPMTMSTKFDNQRTTPLITGQSWQQFGVTVILAHELIHVFTNSPSAGVYGHLQMAQAASAAAIILGFDVKTELELDFPTTQQYGIGEDYDVALAGYHDRVLSYACRKVKL